MNEFAKPYRGGLVGKAHYFALTVYYEDTDTAQIVYYANYLKFMERARSDMLLALGVDHAAVHREEIGAYAVAEVRIRYVQPARLGDDLLVVSRLRQVRAASLQVHQKVMRDGELLAEADLTAAFLTPQGRPQRQPREWIERFQALLTEDA